MKSKEFIIGNFPLTEENLIKMEEKDLMIKMPYKIPDILNISEDELQRRIDELAEGESVKISSILAKAMNFYCPLEKRGVFSQLKEGEPTLAAIDKSFFAVKPNWYGFDKNKELTVVIYYTIKIKNKKKYKNIWKHRKD